MNFEQQRIEVLHYENEVLREKLRAISAVKKREEQVIAIAERYFKLPELSSKIRTKRYVEARAVVAAILRQDGYSFPEIGDALNRDHTTIMYLLDNHKPADFDVRNIRQLINEVEK